MPLQAENKQTLPLKIPPQNLEAEAAVLGAILIDHECIYRVVEHAGANDFYREAHRRIFEAMLTLSEKNEPTDFLTVNNLLGSKGELDLIGGSSYLSSLADSMPSSSHVESYARIVREKSLLRQLIETTSEIATRGYEGGTEVHALLDQAEGMIYNISENKRRTAFSLVKDVVKLSFKKIEELYESQKEITGLASGFKELDALTSGFQNGDLIIIAGRPSMGKTAFALNIAENAAISGGAKVAIFSLEMQKEQLVTRMLCSQARINSSKLRRGRLEERDWPLLTKAAGHLSDIHLYIDDSPTLNVLEMRAKSRRLKREHGLDILFVDYLQLMSPTSKNYSREQEISEISRSLKSLAKELSIPVIALSQLNRAVENRNNRRPQLADLRESGAIEQDADVIAFIYRDEVYDPSSPDKGIAEIIVGKQRNGPTGVCRLAFLDTYTRFENLAYGADVQVASPPMEADASF